MLSIDKVYKEEYIINKSKFISFAYPVISEVEVKEILSDLRKEFADATHICFAYSLSSPRLEKVDDNGEPAGTAGKPILELIKKKNIENVLVVVIRYFGGIKLGAGGLVRAYTHSASLVLSNIQLIEIINVDKFQIEIELSLGAKLMDYIRNIGGEIRSCVYSDKTIIECLSLEKSDIVSIFPSAKIIKIGSEKVCRK